MTSEKAKIVLINPFGAPIQAIGTRLLSAYLKENGHEVKLIFTPTDDPKLEIPKRVIDQLVEHCEGYDLVGFSLMTAHFGMCKVFTEQIKAKYDIPVLWGGVHVSARPDECIKHADLICMGEGEESVLEIANNAKARTFNDIPNVWVNDRENNTIIKNEIRPLVKDLDQYPFQDFDYESHYILYQNHIVKMTKSLFVEHMDKTPMECGGKGITYGILTARNCPHNCTYCYNCNFRELYIEKGPFVRMRTVDNLLEELEWATNNLPEVTSISIKDDVFFVRKNEEFKYFCDEYKKRINLPLRVNLSPMYVTEEKMQMIDDAGLHNYGIGIQSYNEDTLKNIFNRKCTKKMIDDSVVILEKYKAIPQYHFIVHNPYESKYSLRETLNFIASLPTRVDTLGFSLIPFPNTTIYNRMVKDGLMKDELAQIYNAEFRLKDAEMLDYITYLVHFCLSLREKRVSNKKLMPLFKFLSSKPMIWLCDNPIVLSCFKLGIKLDYQFKQFINVVKMVRKQTVKRKFILTHQ